MDPWPDVGKQHTDDDDDGIRVYTEDSERGMKIWGMGHKTRS